MQLFGDTWGKILWDSHLKVGDDTLLQQTVVSCYPTSSPPPQKKMKKKKLIGNNYIENVGFFIDVDFC